MSSVPENIKEAVEEVDNLLKNEPKDIMKQIMQNEDLFVCSMHHSLGQYLRNNWGFWKEEGKLYEHLKKIGLTHADDMSGIILTSYYRHKTNQPLELEKEIQKYKDYWDKVNQADNNTVTFSF